MLPLFLALSLLGCLGDLARTLIGLSNALDDTHRDSLTHVAVNELACLDLQPRAYEQLTGQQNVREVDSR